MRKRLIRDEMFYYRYPHRSEQELNDKPYKYKKPTSHDSKLWFEKHQNLSLFEREEKALELEYDDCDIAVQDKSNLTIDEQIREIGFKGLRSAPMDMDEDEEEEEEEKVEEASEKKEGESTGTETENTPTSPE